MKKTIIAIIVILIVFWGYSWFQEGRNEERFALPERFDKVSDSFVGEERIIDDVDPKSDESDRASKKDNSKILELLSEKLSIATSSIEILSTEEKEWPNSCLGLAGPFEFCGQVIVPGFLIEINLEDKIYFYRTNTDLSIIEEQK